MRTLPCSRFHSLRVIPDKLGHILTLYGPAPEGDNNFLIDKYFSLQIIHLEYVYSDIWLGVHVSPSEKSKMVANMAVNFEKVI